MILFYCIHVGHFLDDKDLPYHRMEKNNGNARFKLGYFYARMDDAESIYNSFILLLTFNRAITKC